MSEAKTCPRCGETKPIEEFAINNTTPKKIYRKRHCKICYQKLWEERKLIRQSAPPPPEDSICQCCGKDKKLKLAAFQSDSRVQPNSFADPQHSGASEKFQSL